MAKHNQTGKWGEDLAVETLVRAGYAIVDRNWRVPPFEVDIIASHRNRIIFCEVKTRSDRDTDPFEAIDKRKILALSRAANAYVKMFDVKLEPQFDVIGISGTPDDYEIQHIPDAFLPPLRTY